MLAIVPETELPLESLPLQVALLFSGEAQSSVSKIPSFLLLLIPLASLLPVQSFAWDRGLNALLASDSAYRRQGLWSKDVETLRQIISFWSTEVGPDSVGVARYSSDMGAALLQTGDYADAEQSLHSAIEIFDRSGPLYAQAAVLAKHILVQVLDKENKTQKASELRASLPPRPKEQKDTGPRILSKVESQYSDKARRHRISGSVRLSVLVDESGHAREVEILDPLGLGLDEAAIKAVKQWIFSPATLNGAPVSTHAIVECTYRLF